MASRATSERAVSPHLAALASHPRPAGSDAAAGARAYCADVLRRAGFQTREQPFEFSAFSGAWSMPIAGVVASLSAILFYLARATPSLFAIAVTTLALMILALAWLGASVLDAPVMRRRAVNLEATRGDVEPAVWLVAHLDSKWQPVSMIARVGGVVGTSLGVAASFALSLAPGHGTATAAAIVLALTWLASIPLMLSVVDARNTGALDNASGVSAVLAAAEQLAVTVNAGVLITDAEELALAGARAWARSRRTAGIALNCDSIDDDGQLTLMYSRSRPHTLVARLVAAATAQGESVRVMRLIPGILTDSVALADARWQTVTLSRGSFRTLQRIHTSHDTLATLRGTGIAVAARVLADTATELG